MLVDMAPRWVLGVLVVVIVCCLNETFCAQRRRHLDKVDKSRRHSAGFPANSLNNSECADLRYGIAYLDNLLAPRVRLAHPPGLTQFRFMHLLTDVHALQADGSYRRNEKSGRFNGLRPDPKIIYGDRLTPRNEINDMMAQIHQILHEAKVNMHRVKSRLHRLMSRTPRHLREDVYNLMRSVYDTRTHARDIIDDMALLPYSLYNKRLACRRQHGNYSCPLPAIRRTKHLQVLAWTWHHARADNEYEAARKLFRKVLNMAGSNRDQLFKLVNIKHEYFRHNTRRNLREHYRRIRRTTARLKRVANLISRLRDKLRIIQRSYKQVNHVLQEYSNLKSMVHKSQSGINDARYAIKSIHGPIYIQLIESLPALFDMRYNYMERRKRNRLETLYRMDVHINSLRDEADWIIAPLDRPMRRANPYTELIEKHFNISTVVKVIGEQIAEAQQNLVEFTELTNEFIKSPDEGSGEIDKEEGTSINTSPSPTVSQTTVDPSVNVTDTTTTEITSPTTTQKECDWWDWACKNEQKKKSTTPPNTPVSKSSAQSSTANIQTVEGSSQPPVPTTLPGTTLIYSTTAQQQTSTPTTTTTPTPTTTTTAATTTAATTTTTTATTTTSTTATTTTATTTTATTIAQSTSTATTTEEPTTPRKSTTQTIKSTKMTIKTSTIPTSTTARTTTSSTETTPSPELTTTSGKSTEVPTETKAGEAEVTPTKPPKTTTTCDWFWGCPKEESSEKTATSTTTTEPTTTLDLTTKTPTTTESETTTTVPSTTMFMTTTAETTQAPETTTESTPTTESLTESETVENKVTPTKPPKITTTCNWFWGCPDEESEMLMDDSSLGSEEKGEVNMLDDGPWWSIFTSGYNKEKKEQTKEESKLTTEEERSKKVDEDVKSEEKMLGDAPWWSIFTKDEEDEKDEDEKGKSKSTTTEKEKSLKKAQSEEKMLGDVWSWWGSSTDDEEEEEEEDVDEKEESKSTTTEDVLTTTKPTTKATEPTTTTTTRQTKPTPTKSGGLFTASQQTTTTSSKKKTAIPTTPSKAPEDERLPETTTAKPNLTPPEAAIVQAFTPSEIDTDELIFEGKHVSSTPEPLPEAVAVRQADDSMFLGIEDCEGSGSVEGGPASCHPQINESTEAAQYLRKKLHKVQGESYKSLFTAKDLRLLVNKTRHHLRLRRRDLYSEIQNFPQDEAVAVHHLVPDVSHLVLPPARVENLDNKMDFVNKKTKTLQERLSSYVHKLNETRTRIAQVDGTRRAAVPPSVEVAKAREQFSKLVQVDYDIAFRARHIKQVAETIDWQLATMKRRIQEAENIHKNFNPVVPLNDQTAMSGRVPASLRRPAAVKTVSVMVKTNSATGSLLKFRPLHNTQSETSIDMGIADGKPCAEWSGKRTKKKVLCERPINDGNWHQLHITRSGNELVLQENSVENPDDIVSNRVTLPVAAMFDPLPKRVQIQPVRHRRHRGKRHVTTFQACLTNLHVDGSYVVMGTNSTQGNLSLETCHAVIMNNTEELPVLSVNTDENQKKCLPHNKTVVDLTSNYGTLFMISVSFITKERKGAILVYRTSADDLWVLRLFQGHVMFEGTLNGERFRKLCYSSTPLTGRQWHLFAVTMDNLASSIILDGEMCLSTRTRLLPQPDSGHTNLTVYATYRDLREVARQRLPSRTHITRFHGRLRDLMVNNRKVSITQGRSCSKKND